MQAKLLHQGYKRPLVRLASRMEVLRKVENPRDSSGMISLSVVRVPVYRQYVLWLF